MQILDRLLGRRRRYTDISVSIHEHIQERADELEEQGMSRAQAEQAARREFGNVALLEERSREMWQWTTLESLLRDIRFCLRRLGKSPGFTVTVLLTLALGIGANTAVFSVLNRVLLQPLPYPDSDRLVALWLNAPGGGLANFSSGLKLSPSMYLTFARHNQTFESIGIWTTRNANVTGVAEPEEVNTARISDGVLQTLGVRPALGRWFSAADQDPHGAGTVLLSYGYWQRRFGSDRSVIGRSIQVDSQTREIVGVMPRGFRMVDQECDLLLPMAFDPNNQKLAPFQFDGIGRLKPGISLQQADADIARLIPVWMDSWSNGPHTNPHYYQTWHITPSFRTLKQQVIGNIGSVLWLVMATVGVVMLIACTNIANLLLVRAEARHQELSIRAALGAGRARIARELLLESLLLGLLGGVLGIGVAVAGLRLLLALSPANLPRLAEISLDARSLGFALLLSVVAGLLFGCVPALRYAGSKNALSMAGSSRTASTGRSRQRSRNGLVVAQVGMALVLLVSAILMIRTFAALRSVSPGFKDPAHVETMSIWIPNLLTSDAQMVTRLQSSIADKLAAIPGVTSVGFAGAVPMDGSDPNWDLVIIEGKRDYEGGEPPIRLFNYVAPGYFQTMGTRFVAGRDYTWGEIYALKPEAIVSENFARENWGSAAAAIGKRVRQFSHNPWQEVIGVVEDVRVHGVDEKAPAIVYWPISQNDPYSPTPVVASRRFVTFAIRSERAGTERFVQQIQEAVWSVNSGLPLASMQTMQTIYSRSLARTSFTLVMLAVAGSMALALSLVGIYGLISYTVAQRTREIGIRLALGAQKGLLRWTFVRSALRLTGAGIALGLAAAVALAQLMRTLLFGVSPLDPLTFAIVPVILACAAVLASYIPACRAAGVNPVDALKNE